MRTQNELLIEEIVREYIKQQNNKELINEVKVKDLIATIAVYGILSSPILWGVHRVMSSGEEVTNKEVRELIQKADPTNQEIRNVKSAVNLVKKGFNIDNDFKAKGLDKFFDQAEYWYESDKKDKVTAGKIYAQGKLRKFLAANNIDLSDIAFNPYDNNLKITIKGKKFKSGFFDIEAFLPGEQFKNKYNQATSELKNIRKVANQD